MSSLELHLHLGTAWSSFRPQAEWGAGWGWWRLLLLAGCSAVRREGEQGRGHHGVWGADRGASRAPCSEADRSACRFMMTVPCRGDRWRGSWEEASLGGLGEGSLGHPSSPHVSSTPQPSMRCTSVLCCVLTPAVPHLLGLGCVGGQWMQKAPRVLVNRSKNCFQAAEALCGKGNWWWCLRSYGWWGAALARRAVWGISEELPLSLEPTCVRRGESKGTHLCRQGRHRAELSRPGVDACPAQCWVLQRAGEAQAGGRCAWSGGRGTGPQ